MHHSEFSRAKRHTIDWCIFYFRNMLKYIQLVSFQAGDLGLSQKDSWPWGQSLGPSCCLACLLFTACSRPRSLTSRRRLVHVHTRLQCCLGFTRLLLRL